MPGKGPGIGFSSQGAPVDAPYLTVASVAALTQERRFVAGTALTAVDGGANGDFTLNHAQVATGDLHQDYVLAAGTRPLTGNWDVGPFNIIAANLQIGAAGGKLTMPFNGIIGTPGSSNITFASADTAANIAFAIDQIDFGAVVLRLRSSALRAEATQIEAINNLGNLVGVPFRLRDALDATQGGGVLDVNGIERLVAHSASPHLRMTGDATVSGTLAVTGIATLATASTIGNLTLADGSITDSSGAIDFGNESLTTSGVIRQALNSASVGTSIAGTITQIQILADATNPIAAMRFSRNANTNFAGLDFVTGNNVALGWSFQLQPIAAGGIGFHLIDRAATLDGTTDPTVFYAQQGTNRVGIGADFHTNDTPWGDSGNPPFATLHVRQETLGEEVHRLDTISGSTSTDNPTEQVFQNRVATTDATVTTLHTFAIPTSDVVQISAYVTARRTSGTEQGAGYLLRATYKNAAGTVTLIGAVNKTADEDVGAWDVNLTISGTNVLVEVTGVAAINITWHMTARTWALTS